MPSNTYKIREHCQCGAEIEIEEPYSTPSTWNWKINHARGCNYMYECLTSDEKATSREVKSI
ncbi:hypothetical protein LCGC14_1483490 [marine sediment metagenome]|uniref:Uncharacterized protein n=1 Tax=marine sediment metagenome TaxID=412755 RepID=A0A0F9LPB4_9ZZZZ